VEGKMVTKKQSKQSYPSSSPTQKKEEECVPAHEVISTALKKLNMAKQSASPCCNSHKKFLRTLSFMLIMQVLKTKSKTRFT
jgi:hypothetical protein